MSRYPSFLTSLANGANYSFKSDVRLSAEKLRTAVLRGPPVTAPPANAAGNSLIREEQRLFTC